MGLTEGSIFSGFPAIASPLAQFIVQLVIILSFTRLIVLCLKPLRQPAVIGEVIAGILLGPSALSRIPAFKTKIFPEDSISRLQLFANVALVLFMFTIGLELDFRVITKNLRKSVAISLAGIIVPFGLGATVAVLIQQHYATPSGSYISFVLFGGTAMSITAFPVLARILSEMRLLGTKVGATTMNAAAVDDVLAWTILAVVIATARASDPSSAAWTILSALAFMCVMALIVRPILRAAFARNQQQIVRSNRAPTHGNDELPSWLFAAMVILCFVCAYTTEVLGVHAIFGAFVCGLIVPRDGNLHIKIGHKIEDLVVTIFLPLYFTFSGLRTQFNALDDSMAWGMVVLVITAAVLGKFGGCTLAARLSGLGWREAATTGVFMNTKGLVELIVLNVGLDLGVLSPLVFAIFVFMALTTTFMTVPMVWCIYPPDQIREDDRKEKLTVPSSTAKDIEMLPFGGSHGFSRILVPSTAAHEAAPLLSAAAAMLSPATSTLPAALQHQVRLCHMLPITDRPSTYLHEMFDSGHAFPATALLPRKDLLAGEPVDAGEEVPRDLWSDYVFLMGVERARQLGDAFLTSLKLHQIRGSDMTGTLHDELKQFPADLILLAHSDDGVGAAFGQPILSSLADRMFNPTSNTIHQLVNDTPDKAFGLLLTGGVRISQTKFSRALLVLTSSPEDTALAYTVGGALVANGIDLDVLLLTDALVSPSPSQQQQQQEGEGHTTPAPRNNATQKPMSLGGLTDALAKRIQSLAVGRPANPADTAVDGVRQLIAGVVAVGAQAVGNDPNKKRAVAADILPSVHVAHPHSVKSAVKTLSANQEGGSYDLVIAGGRRNQPGHATTESAAVTVPPESTPSSDFNQEGGGAGATAPLTPTAAIESSAQSLPKRMSRLFPRESRAMSRSSSSVDLSGGSHFGSVLPTIREHIGSAMMMVYLHQLQPASNNNPALAAGTGVV